MPNLTFNSVQALLAENTKALMEQIATLRAEVASAALIADNTQTLKDEIASLRNEVAELRASLAASKEQQTQSDHPAVTCSTPANQESRQSWADVLKASVQSALSDQSSKNEIVVHLPENKRDSEDIEAICQKASIAVKPSAITRIGKPRANRPRPLKASFPS